MKTAANTDIQRPIWAEFKKPADYFRAMLSYLKVTEPGFSILAGTRTLRKVSPTLVTLVLKGERQLTLDRVDEFAKLFRLTATEKSALRQWLTPQSAAPSTAPAHSVPRKEVSTHILNDWLNVYVKDCFEIPEVQKKPELIHQQLAHLASPARLEKSLRFLLREGYLRKTLEGRIVPDTPLSVMDTQIPSQKIRNFHKAALQIARVAIDSHAAHERYANTLILSMDQKKYQELVSLVQDFAEKLKDFAEQSSGPRLYQVALHLSPTGGKFE